MPEPSSAYSACLEPREGVRRIVTLSGIALYAAGAGALLSLPASGAVVAMLTLAWLVLGLALCRRRLRENRRVEAILVHETGALEPVSSIGKRRPADGLPGSIVLERAIWLRYRAGDGSEGAELFLGAPRRDPDFRRAGNVLRLLAIGRKN